MSKTQAIKKQAAKKTTQKPITIRQEKITRVAPIPESEKWKTTPKMREALRRQEEQKRKQGPQIEMWKQDMILDPKTGKSRPVGPRQRQNTPILKITEGEFKKDEIKTARVRGKK